VGHFNREFQGEGDIAHQPLLVPVSENRLITLSCGVKISAVCSFDSSQSRRVTDGRTDRITIPKTSLAQLLRAVKIGQHLSKL